MPSINKYWDYIREKYPDARFNFWYSVGELLFYPNGGAEARDDALMTCFWRNGKFVIAGEF